MRDIRRTGRFSRHMMLVTGLLLAAQTASASSLEWHSSAGSRPAPHLSTAAEIEVSGLVARVRLIQRFRNGENRWVEGLYTYPLPDGAAVDGLAMRYGNTLIVGEIREKETAARLYGEARDAGRRTVLVDRQRPNLFTTRVANVGPNETVEIEITWQQTVTFDSGEYGLHLPLTVTPRYMPDEPDGVAGGGVDDAEALNPPRVAISDGHRLSLSGVIDAGVELAEIAGRYHPLRVGRAGTAYRIAFEDTAVPMDRDIEIRWRPLPGTAPSASLYRGAGREGERTVLLFFQPPHGTPAASSAGEPREVVFVIDTSGSMHGHSLAQAKEALALALRRLGPDDRFNVIEFNSRARRFFPVSVPATSQHVTEALTLIGDLAADGGTEMEPALRAALAPVATDRLRQVVFITDGAVGNEAGLLELIRNRLGESRLFTVAIGSAPNRWFMRKAAEAGRGTSLVIGSVGEVAGQMTRLFRRLEYPALTDLAIEWPPGMRADTYPGPIPDLYHGEPLMVTARLNGPLPPDAIITVSGSRGDGYWMRQLVLDEARPYPGVTKLWARGRIEALEDAARAGADPDQTRTGILATAMEHHLVTAHTSLVAVDASPSRPAFEDLEGRRVPGLLAHGQSAAAIFGLPATGTLAPLRRLIGAFCLLAGLALLVALRWHEIRRFNATS